MRRIKYEMKCETNTLPTLMHQLMLISTNQVSLVMLRSKKLEPPTKKKKKSENCERAIGWKPKQSVISPSEDRAMPEGDNPSFWDEFIKFSFSLTVQFIFVF
jgi:hypothetical protein